MSAVLNSTSGNGHHPAAEGRFAGKVAIITGASRGIGRGVAVAFAREGADVVVNYASNHAAAEEVASEIRALGRRCVLVAGSVGDPAVAESLAQSALKELGRIDVLVNNAGIGKDGHLMMMADSTWESVLDINLHGSFYCTRAVTGAMIAQGSGTIVNMSSSSGVRGRAGQVSYAATKGALLGLTTQFARELGPYGVRVNALAPGFIETDMIDGLLGRPGVKDAFISATPMRRLGTSDDIAEATLFLASPASSFVTGHVMLINGGLLMI
jgi:3-oxoacyl-[acyl-carrier protein] reductase